MHIPQKHIDIFMKCEKKKFCQRSHFLLNKIFLVKLQVKTFPLEREREIFQCKNFWIAIGWVQRKRRRRSWRLLLAVGVHMSAIANVVGNVMLKKGFSQTQQIQDYSQWNSFVIYSQSLYDSHKCNMNRKNWHGLNWLLSSFNNLHGQFFPDKGL